MTFTKRLSLCVLQRVSELLTVNMSSCSSKVMKKADPYQEEKIQFLQRVSSFWLNHGQGFPSPRDVASWNVYLLSQGWVHYSLMFESEETGKAFKIHLLKGHNIDTEHYEVELHFKVIDTSHPHYR